jgi:hypothetical protein
MDKVERAKELFTALEEGRIRSATEIARRAFYIQERLSEMSG